VCRLLTRHDEPVDDALLRRRLEAAWAFRRTLAYDGDAGRVVFGDGDALPGLIVDRYGDVLVLQALMRWSAARAERLAALAAEVTGADAVYHRGDPTAAAIEGFEDESGWIVGRAASVAPIREGPCRFRVDVEGAQKTGFYLDQRENRIRLRRLARGARVLNLFSYSGGFSIAALASGAARAVDVDSSEAALALSREHRRANGLPEAEEDFVRADVFEDVRRRAAAGERWDVVICDPPAFAKKRSDLERAPRAYKDVNRLAMTLVAPGGWLLTCSCSGHVSADLFQKIVFSASVEARAPMTIVARQGAGEDHPVSLDCPEGEYLKGLWLRRES
jgi:23S rRNA (cytosine1962-C5)-methyltransferase